MNFEIINRILKVIYNAGTFLRHAWVPPVRRDVSAIPVFITSDRASSVYRYFAPIVQSACKSFHLPYHVEPTFYKALSDHLRMLKKLGTKEMQVSPTN